MNEAAIQEKIGEILRMVQSAPTGAKAPAVAEGCYISSREGDTFDHRLDQLRMQVKYLLFDLEATKRENRYLLQMLENRRRGDDPRRGEREF